jgi:hypothetical protein
MNVLGLQELTSVDAVLTTGRSLLGDVKTKVPSRQHTQRSFKVAVQTFLSGIALSVATFSVNSIAWSDARIPLHPPVTMQVPDFPTVAPLPELDEKLLDASWQSALDVLASAGADLPILLAGASERLEAWRRTPLAISDFNIDGEDDRA